MRLGRMTAADQFAAVPAFGLQVSGGINGNPTSLFVTFSPQEDISLLPLMGFAGTIWQGVVPGRDRDQLLLTYLGSDFSRSHTVSVAGHGDHHPTVEHVLEAGYAIYVRNNYTIQPDIQYVIRPNGLSDVRNSLVIGIQLIASY
ncbi:MAG TPA: carbohydrate porin [Chthoniobacterales bacterium]|nr:carbohydrate porin [Chthoniobacterales bacterium]